MPRILVLYVKLGAQILAAVAARIPSLKLHIPCIRTLRISVCSSSARGLRRVLLIRCAPSFPNGLFSRHSNKGNSLTRLFVVRGGDSRHSHRLGQSSHYATSPAWRLRNRMPRILVLFVKLGAHILAAVAARVPSLKLHIPLIRTP